MSASATDQAEVVVIDDRADAFEVFDAVCRRELDMGGREFLQRWDAGDYACVDADDIEGLSEVIAAMSAVR